MRISPQASTCLARVVRLPYDHDQEQEQQCHRHHHHRAQDKLDDLFALPTHRVSLPPIDTTITCRCPVLPVVVHPAVRPALVAPVLKGRTQQKRPPPARTDQLNLDDRAGSSVLGACPALTFLLRRTIRDHLRRSRLEKILNVFQRIRLRFFRALRRSSGNTSFASSRRQCRTGS